MRGRRAREVWLLAALVLLASGCVATAGSPQPGPSALVAADQAAGSPVITAVDRLPVQTAPAAVEYRRDAFGQAWSDDVTVAGGHNGCDTRNDVLRRDLGGLVVKPGTQGCVALSGTLADPYTGAVLAFRRGSDTSPLVQIDHVVALADAWRTGAASWSPSDRQNLANDPLELLAVAGQANQDKGDGDAAAWLPPNAGYRCAYVARQVAVKQAYRLAVTPAERAAMLAVLVGCPSTPLPTAASTAVPAIVADG